MKFKITLLAFSFLQLTSAFAQNGWQNLFDGKSLNGWKQLTGTATYQVTDGAIAGTTVLNSPIHFLSAIKSLPVILFSNSKQRLKIPL